MKKEPALIIGAVIAALTVVGQVVSGDLTWAAAVPLIASAIVRQFVTPAKP